MKIKTLVSKFFASNSYLVINEDTAIIIDPSCEVKQAKVALDGKLIKAILLTHAHADHFVYLQDYVDEYQCLVYCHQNAIDKIEDPQKNYSLYVGKSLAPKLAKDNYHFVTDNEELLIDALKIKVMEAPGHSNCSVIYLIDDAMFSGDTLFKQSIGRTDFYTSNSRDMLTTLKRIVSLADDYLIYPGHDETTTLAFEKVHNRYLRKVKP